jgi:hypothetical protein
MSQYCDLPGYDTVYCGRWVSKFRRNIIPPYSGWITTRCHNPEHNNINYNDFCINYHSSVGNVFNDNVGKSYNTAPNCGKVMNNGLEGMLKEAIVLNSRHCLGICLQGLRNPWKTSLKIFCVPTEIRSWNLPNARQKHYLLNILLSINCNMSVLKFQLQTLELSWSETEKENEMECAVSLNPVNKYSRCVIFHNDKIQEFCCISRHDQIGLYDLSCF